MPARHEYCTIIYDDDSYSVCLPDEPPTDFHAFVKEELVAAGAQSLSNRDIQVQAVGMNLPDTLSPSFAVRPGSYRVTIRHHEVSDSKQKQHWKPTLRLPCLNKVEYWAEEDAIPGALNLQLQPDMASINTAELLERRRHYIADRQPLEAAFHQLYQSRSADLKFGISKDAGHIQQTAQRIFLRELCERQLMLRVRNFALGKELLLRVSKTDGSLCGYIEDKGIIEQLALQEFEAFVKLPVPQLVLVLDLDQTIVHTPPHGSVDQQILAGYVESGRVFNVCCKGPWHEEMVCAPRAYLVQFFTSLFQKYHVMYCTAGAAEYGIEVVRNLRAFMLHTAGASLDEHQQRWITGCTDTRRLVSTRSICPRNRQFKSLGMLLKMAYVPEYVQQIVIVLDDNPHVWKAPVDREIASLVPVPQQRLVTSDTCARPWLHVFSDLAINLYFQAFAHGSPTKALREVLRDVGLQSLQNELRNGGH